MLLTLLYLEENYVRKKPDILCSCIGFVIVFVMYMYVCVCVFAPVRKNGCADYCEGKSIINQSINQSTKVEVIRLLSTTERQLEQGAER